MIQVTTKTGPQVIQTVEEIEAKRQFDITEEATRRIEAQYPPLLQRKEFSKSLKILLNALLIVDPSIVSKLSAEDQAALSNTLAIDADITAVRGKENAAHAAGTPVEDVIW